MNARYDNTKARNLLDALRLEYLTKDADVEIPMLANLKIEDVYILDSQYPRCMRLTVRDEGEELDAVIRLQGVLCGKALGPILTRPFGMNGLSKIRNLRQHVKITALGSDDIEQDFKKLDAIASLFADHAVNKEILPFDFLPFEGWKVIESHARYFTDRALSPFDKNIPFNRNVDPSDILSKLQPEEFIHGPDNVVEYCKRVFGKDGEISHEECSPGLFKAGDVVEIAFSVIGIPIRDDRIRLMLLLRGLTLIEDGVRKESEVYPKDSVQSQVEYALQRTPKRRAVYLKSSPESSPSKRACPSADDVRSTPDLAIEDTKTVEEKGNGKWGDEEGKGAETSSQGDGEDEDNLKAAAKAFDEPKLDKQTEVDADDYESEKELGEIVEKGSQEGDEMVKAAENEDSDGMIID